ncbi:tRNA (adenosine(37)-N6)-threonylcarbamoyltransferase complex dimerization subunit type 1 TsaB [Georgenia halophila]|uniref:tRNA (Adenosine(37)-N6)-threonylcarbamoyltransferase complex dimerization subunit type 1 TsaB n=1 Tax=Georgenia halophila TaxID=620889 RepID=A0ABP8KWP5_9MICO
MLTLGIDTSGGSRVALVESAANDLSDGLTVLGHDEGADPRRHAEVLAPMIERLLSLRPSGPELVAVGTGPAPFTGLRAGIVTARVFARARGVPVHGVCSLDALARQTLDVLGDDATEVLVVTDARRREVYWARYRAAGPDDVERLAGPEVAAPAAVAERHATTVEGGLVVAGGGAVQYSDVLAGREDLPAAVEPAVLARLVLARLARRSAGEEVELGLEPRYLRRPDVQLPGAAKRVG